MSHLVAVLTDFGWDDPYLAEVKAALHEQWQRFPDLKEPPSVVDLCHTIPAGDIAAASWFLARIQNAYPAGTVHLGIVDPGVGTERPLLAAKAQARFYVGPGNGLLTFLRGAADLEVILLDNPLYHRTRGNRGPAPTFQGRDIMAPVAAHLAAGVPLSQVGSSADADALGRLGQVSPTGPTVTSPHLGQVVWIDRFGNAITDIRRDSKVGERLARGGRLLVDGREVVGPFTTFGAAPAGQLFWYWGSGDCLEIAMACENAAARYGWHRGLAIHPADP